MFENILNSALLENSFIKFTFIVLSFYVVSKIIQLIVIGNIKRVTAKTKTKLDDLLIEAIKKPFLKFMVLIGLKIAINILPFSEKVLLVLQRTLTSILMIIIILFVMKISRVTM